jgi:hypothetical protein
MEMRNMYISLLFLIAILFSGGFVFRGSEAASVAVFVVGFGGGFAVLNILDAREHRREGRE